MSTVTFSNARIQFVQNGRETPDPVSWERALVVLIQLDFGEYSVRAVDLANNKQVRRSRQADHLRM